jgi:putative SbcD/Mre11-related phosphoesterase
MLKPAPIALSQFCPGPGLIADARRALWLAEERALVVADLHLGYAWAHRYSGNLLPVTAGEDAVDRLIGLQEEYQPREVIILGDLVHRAVAVPAIHEALRMLIDRVSSRCVLTVVLGNHDRHLARLLSGMGRSALLVDQLKLGPHLLLHGDRAASESVTGWTLIGHEHPVIGLGDGVTAAVKCPCFLVSEKLIVLPAFSRWAAGSPVTRGTFLSPLARQVAFTHALAVVGERLLPVPLGDQDGDSD